MKRPFLAGDPCIFCRRQDLPLHPQLGYCPRCEHFLQDHTEACFKSMVKHHHEWVVFYQRYPDFCQYCWGTGVREYPATRMAPPDSDDCGHCAAHLRCPICGHESLKGGKENPVEDDMEQGNGPCSICGWNYADEEPASKISWKDIPSQFECSCWMEREKEATLSLPDYW